MPAESGYKMESEGVFFELVVPVKPRSWSMDSINPGCFIEIGFKYDPGQHEYPNNHPQSLDSPIGKSETIPGSDHQWCGDEVKIKDSHLCM
jgi:hypothetical protein